jgi:CRP/FNR family transcriptional regulator, cyclic AMP receptor protein
MITLEKLLVLKTIPLFRYVPDDILLVVAGTVKEQAVAAGELIIQKNDWGTTMYMIVTGKVKVHHDDDTKKWVTLAEREVFGELAALSPEQRIASVTAIEDTLLLTLTHTDLSHLIDMHVGVAKGIISVLCQKVRAISIQ